MNETMILQSLEAIAEKLGIQINYENLKKKHIFSKGGLYRLKEDKAVVIDTNLNLSEKIDVLADALSQFDLEDIYMPPAVRKIVINKSSKNVSADKDPRQEREETESQEQK